MTFGALTFLSPWLLAALATLPIIYWLLRTIPPNPRRVEFPPTRILKEVENQEKTPSKTPWWLLLLRLLAAALIIIALAEPILNPSRNNDLAGSGPLAIVVDNGWASANTWDQRVETINSLIDTAESQSRPVILVETAAKDNARQTQLKSPAQARVQARSISPQPFAPNLTAAAKALETALSQAASPQAAAPTVVLLTDGIDHDGNIANAFSALNQLADGATFAVVETARDLTPLALAAEVGDAGKLSARVIRATGTARSGTITAFSARGENLGQTSFQLASGTNETTADFDVPLELRNQIARISIEGVRSAGAVHLLDARSQWRRVALISSEDAEAAQPLLASLYYLDKALKPYAQLIKPKDRNIIASIDSAIAQQANVIILADIGTLSGEPLEKLEDWVTNGGLLVRFAGPRMEKATDTLLPVRLRLGGRELGGALSWSTPQPLANFENQSPFSGLEISNEITISRQVLADPNSLTGQTRIWARLNDGTPLVTAARRGDGELIMFHVTANTDWSSLPISGLFVQMLKRILNRANAGGSTGVSQQTANGQGGSEGAAQSAAEATLLPIQTLDGYGNLGPPPPTAQPVQSAEFPKTIASHDHPPGFYGTRGTPNALNIATEETALKPIPPFPSGTKKITFDTTNETPLKPWLLAAALALILLDVLAVLLLQGLLGSLFRTKPKPGGAPATAPTIAVLLAPLALIAALGSMSTNGHAQTAPAANQPADTAAQALDRHARQATRRVTLGYVLTGDPKVDRTSESGLTGLGRVLSKRTSITPGKPIGIDIENDEIAFYPVLYWPVLPNARPPSAATLAKIDAYMKQGGLIVFDTQDYGFARSPSLTSRTGDTTPLQRLLGKLDIPRIEPVPAGHVLTKSFYLLRDFPGRWSGGQLWVEAGGGADANPNDARNHRATRTDGVTSIMITSNDLAAAWALDERGRPLFPMVNTRGRQREMAFRTGINIVMHALTGNYKADQVHVPSLLQRLGQ